MTDAEAYRAGLREGMEAKMDSMSEKLEPPTTFQDVINLVSEQAEDEGLWFDSRYITEAYLQQELRKLHSAIESVKKPEPAPVCVWRSVDDPPPTYGNYVCYTNYDDVFVLTYNAGCWEHPARFNAGEKIAFWIGKPIQKEVGK